MDKLYKLEEKVYEHMTNAVNEIVVRNMGLKDIYVDDGLKGVGTELAKLVLEIHRFAIQEGMDLFKYIELVKDWEKTKDGNMKYFIETKYIDVNKTSVATNDTNIIRALKTLSGNSESGYKLEKELKTKTYFIVPLSISEIHKSLNEVEGIKKV